LRSRDGIQYVEHAEGHGDKMFAAVCDLGLEGIVSKKIDAPVQVRAIKGVVENLKSEGARGYPRGGWELLIRSQVIAGVTCPSREVVVNPFCNSPSLYFGGPEYDSAMTT
jgi:hypothetical protein